MSPALIALCFPGTATVISLYGPKRMDEVRQEDVLRVMSVEGNVEWSMVCGWVHRDPAGKGAFLRITTSRRQIVIAAEHLIATLPSETGIVVFRQAQELRVGDRIVEAETAEQSPKGQSAVWGNTITHIDTVQASAGLYAPLTVEGTLVIDGVVVSCYASTRSHHAAHASMRRVRTQWRRHPERREDYWVVGKHPPGTHRGVDRIANLVRRP